MADNRRYYYLKLKDNYFDEDSIVLLESMKDGILYSNILLKLYLKSLKNGGKLQLDENIPYTSEMIATITRHQTGTVERALQIFHQLGLVEIMENGGYYMSNIELLIGQSSTEGERKRRARLEIKAQKSLAAENGGQWSGQKADICPPELEKEKEIELKKELERKADNGQNAHRSYGHYSNVFLSQTEYEELVRDFPQEYSAYIDRLSQYMASSGKHYESHSATIRYWITMDQQKGILRQSRSDYECTEDESL
jgi:predicted phage replisome organizer